VKLGLISVTLLVAIVSEKVKPELGFTGFCGVCLIIDIDPILEVGL